MMEEIIKPNFALYNFTRIKPQFLPSIVNILTIALVIFECFFVCDWICDNTPLLLIFLSIIILSYVFHQLFKENVRLRAICIQVTYLAVSIWSLLLLVQNPLNYLPLFTVLTFTYFSSFIMQRKREHLFYLGVMELILILLNLFYQEVNIVLLGIFPGIAIVSFISGRFHSGLRKIIMETRSVLNNSGQFALELDKDDTLHILNSGFLSSLGCTKEMIKPKLYESFQNSGYDFEQIISSTNESLPQTFFLTISKGDKSIKSRISLVNMVHNGKSRRILLGFPICEGNDSAAFNRFFMSDNEKKLNLPLLINCFKRDLTQKCPDIKIDFREEITEHAENAFFAQNIFDHLSVFFREEFEACDKNLNLNFEVKTNAFITSFSFIWKRPFASFHFPDKLKLLIQEHEGNFFNLIREDQKVQFLFFLPNSELLRGNKFPLPKIENYADYMYFEQLMNSLNKFLTGVPFSVDILTRDMGTSRMQLHRKVKAMLGVSPGNLFQFIRMKKAETLLKSGDTRIAEIAYSLGYCDQSHFSKAFRAWFGVPPIQYVKAIAA